MPGTLYIVATPIGNLEDITLRALRILRDEVNVIACEDTRKTGKLLEHFKIRKPLLSYHDHNEGSRAAELVAKLEAGESIALVSDAGTPLVSDPGFRLVTLAIEHHIQVVPIPGASALLANLAASGLPTDEFRFVGFVPQKSGARRHWLELVAEDPATVIAYESPHRILETLADMAQVFGTRTLVIGRELTKLHEEFLRGPAAQLREILASRPSVKGEFTISFGKNTSVVELTNPLAEVERLQKEEGLDRMAAIKAVAKRFGLPKREVYRLAAAEGNNQPGKQPN